MINDMNPTQFPLCRTAGCLTLALSLFLSTVTTDARVDDDQPVLEFDGQYSYVEARQEVEVGTGDFTYEVWFKPYSLDRGNQGLMGTGRGDSPDRRGINLRYDSGGELVFRAANRDGNIELSEQLFDAGQWIHVAATVQRGGWAVLYVNGAPVDTVETIALGEADGFDIGPFLVGRRAHSGSEIWFFDGAMAELRVWNTARSQEEILENMNRSLDEDEEGLLLYWPMNEGEGAVLSDRSGNLNDGMIHGAAWKD